MRNIPGYTSAVLDTEWLYGSRIENLIKSEFPEKEICETPGNIIPPDKKIKLFDTVEQNDIFYVTITFGDDCKRVIEMKDDSDGKAVFSGPKTCGGKDPKPKEDGKTEDDGKTEEGVGTLVAFQTWVEEENNFGPADTATEVDSNGDVMPRKYSGPDDDGVFTAVIMGTSFRYKWNGTSWEQQ